MLWEYIKQAYVSIISNKKTSVLTMIGIIIGLCAVITIMTIGDTISVFLQNYISQTEGGNTITVNIYSRDDKYFFTEEELDKISESHPPSMVGVLRETESFSGLAFVDDSHYSQSSMIGVSPEYSLYKNLKFTQGEFFDYSVGDKPVAVISNVAAECLFGSESAAIGEKLTLNTINPRSPLEAEYIELYIIGVYQFKDTNNVIQSTPDKRKINCDIYVPYKFVNSYFNMPSENIPDVSFQAVDHENMAAMSDYLYTYVEQRFVGDDNYKYYFSNRNDREGIDDTKMMINVVAVFFIVIACISLVVGGIGLMNTMLISVTRRTKEIGIRKALGAKNSAIRIQFIIESVLICLIACVIGVLLSLITSKIIENNISPIIDMITDGNDELQQYAANFKMRFIPTWSSIFKTSLFSISVGTVFGYYPANKGAKMQPVDALRFE